MNRQRFLLLQGPCSPFFFSLGQALRDAGHVVRKVNFTVGDRIYWRLGQAASYHGSMAQLPAFYTRQYEQYGISDLVLFGDCRPVHRPAIELAKQHGIRVHVFEEGYFRPHWITLERDGVNGHSSLPRDPDWYHQQTSFHTTHYDNGASFKTAFWKRAAWDVIYNAAGLFNPILHLGVNSHVCVHPFKEYLGYIKRGLTLPWHTHQSRKLVQQLISESPQHPFYLLPLQLDSDTQITRHSPFTSMPQAMRHTLDSFARAAPRNTRLVVKLHPLDPGLINYRQHLLAATRDLNIAHRIFFLESGHLPSLLSATRGVVTVNSTVGSSALIHGRPTVALGTAIYALPGLTFQGELDAFWQSDEPPDKTLFRHFRDIVIAHTQINGGFYCAAGIGLAVRNSIPRLIEAVAKGCAP